jgi:hypothetical protein
MVAGATLLVPQTAAAETALLRIRWTWYWQGGTWGGETPQGYYTNPRIKPPEGPMPSAGAAVGTTTIGGYPAQKIMVPRAVLTDRTVTWYCKPGTCYKGYPTSGGIYSVENLTGMFRPNNPYAASAYQVLRFPTTMSGPPTYSGPYGQGEPRTPTTTFPIGRWINYTTAGPGTVPTTTTTGNYRERGNYDFERGGSIRITPGPHRFGGTMRYLYGEDGFWYQYITINTGFISTAYVVGTPQWQRTANDEAEIGEKVSGGYGIRYRWTINKDYKATDGNGNSIWWRNQYIDTAMPWTTGDLVVFQPLGTFVTTLTYGGNDGRTSMGLSGTISMVRARLRHSYLKPSNLSEPVDNIWSAGRLDRIDLMFGPEPGAVLMLGAGIATLAGLALARHRRR